MIIIEGMVKSFVLMGCVRVSASEVRRIVHRDIVERDWKRGKVYYVVSGIVHQLLLVTSREWMNEIRLTGFDRNSMIVIILSHPFFSPRVPFSLSARVLFLRSVIAEERRADMLVHQLVWIIARLINVLEIRKIRMLRYSWYSPCLANDNRRKTQLQPNFTINLSLERKIVHDLIQNLIRITHQQTALHSECL